MNKLETAMCVVAVLMWVPGLFWLYPVMVVLAGRTPPKQRMMHFHYIGCLSFDLAIWTVLQLVFVFYWLA